MTPAVLVVIEVICAMLGAAIMYRKGRSVWVGAILGALFGVIGLLILAFFKKSTRKVMEEREAGAVATAALAATNRKCPWCAEWMKRNLSLCPRCGRPSDPWIEHEGRWWTQSPSTGRWLWRDEDAGRWQESLPDMSAPG